jgi:hypothetical protein
LSRRHVAGGVAFISFRFLKGVAQWFVPEGVALGLGHDVVASGFGVYLLAFNLR